MAKNIPDNVVDAIKALAKDGTIIEAGFLDTLKHKNIGLLTRNMPTPLAFMGLGGSEMRIRKGIMPLGAKRDDIKNKDYWYNVNSDLQDVKVDQSFWIRMNWDLEALTALGDTYRIETEDMISDSDSPEVKTYKQSRIDEKKKNLQEAIFNLTIKNAIVCFEAKIDAEAISTLGNSLNATEVFTDLSTFKASTGTTPLLQEKILGFQTDIATALANLECKIDSYTLGTEISNYQGLVYPILIYLMQIFYRNYSANNDTNNPIKQGTSGFEMFQGVKFEKHPFFNQLVNTKASDFANVDRTKTIFDLSTTYDFTGLLGVVWHKYALVFAFNLQALQLTIDPDTLDPQLVGRMMYKCALVRDDLIIKILNQATDQPTYDNEILALVKSLADPANSIVVANQGDIATNAQASFKTYAGAATVADIKNAVVNSANPPKASTVTAPTPFVLSVNIPVKSGKKASPYENFNLTAYYKNA